MYMFGFARFFITLLLVCTMSVGCFNWGVCSTKNEDNFVDSYVKITTSYYEYSYKKVIRLKNSILDFLQNPTKKKINNVRKDCYRLKSSCIRVNFFYTHYDRDVKSQDAVILDVLDGSHLDILGQYNLIESLLLWKNIHTKRVKTIASDYWKNDASRVRRDRLYHAIHQLSQDIQSSILIWDENNVHHKTIDLKSRFKDTLFRIFTSILHILEREKQFKMIDDNILHKTDSISTTDIAIIKEHYYYMALYMKVIQNLYLGKYGKYQGTGLYDIIPNKYIKEEVKSTIDVLIMEVGNILKELDRKGFSSHSTEWRKTLTHVQKLIVDLQYLVHDLTTVFDIDIP